MGDNDGVCICGHGVEAHGANGTCQVEGCLCAGYEEVEEDTEDSPNDLAEGKTSG